MLTLIAWLILIAILVPNLVIAVELLAGSNPRGLPLPGAPVPQVTVLMPAHDEAAVIGPIVDAVLDRLPPGGRLLVVADNCSDDTAQIARAAGAEVVERQDPTKRGKGFALDFGRSYLQASPPDVVVVLDADCTPEPRAIERLARGAVAHGRPVQATYLFEPQPTGSPMLQISGFAFLVKNLVREAGLERIGAPVVLTGSGMAFPWQAFAAAPLDTGDIVEDLAIGVALARQRLSPRFDASARIWTKPAATGSTLGQRTRWEHGFIATARRTGLPLVREGMRTRRPGLSWLGLHLLVPPLALLLAIDAAALALLLGATLLGAPRAPFLLALILVGLVVAGVLLAWSRHGREQVTAGTLARVPLYLLWKLPIYLKLVRSGAETQWVRTDRTGDE